MSEEDKSKVIIDEDWKAKVQREKEEARKAAEAAPKPPEEEAGAAEEAPDAASFQGLLSSLATQAMFALGALAPRDTKQVTVDIGQGKFIVDTLMMLREKTKGNLTDQEQGQLAQTIAELQRIYVVRVQQAQEAALRGAGPQRKGPGA